MDQKLCPSISSDRMSSPDSNANAGTQNVSKEQVESILLFIKSVQLAQSRGAYSLEEARVIADAVDKFVVKEPNADGASNDGKKPAQVSNDFSKLRMDVK